MACYNVVSCSRVPRVAIAAMLLCMSQLVAGSGDFLTLRKPSKDSFENALAEVLGCGARHVDVSKVEKALMPMWRALPKNARGLIEWRMVRYLAHRYFMQQSSLMIRGFEPMRQINSSQMIGMLTENTHAGVHAAIEGKGSSEGFAFGDVVTVIATLEQLIQDEEMTLLEFVLKESHISLDAHFRPNEFKRLLEDYVIYWMLQEDVNEARVGVRDRHVLKQALPKWDSIVELVQGTVENVHFARSHASGPSSAPFHMNLYTVDDARKAVSSITTRFASFWESECQSIKTELVAMDGSGTGRVGLSAFYGANTDGVWHFAESETYLREVGALDETSTLRGNQVIIPNYLQAPSNCIVTAPQYLVCCVNECEEVLNELEDSVGGPVALPDEIMQLVAKMTNLDDDPVRITSSLSAQLQSIAKTNGGLVPLHGRLFSQWLHFVFPRECPFPLGSGARSAATPAQYGDKLLAKPHEIDHHASRRNISGTAAFKDHAADFAELQWMSQWSEEEELMADYSLQLRAPWELSYTLALSSLAAFATVLAATSRAASFQGVDALDTKPHYV